MTTIETDAAGRPIAYDSAGNPLAVDAVHGRPVTIDGDPAYVARPAYVERPVVVERRGGGAGWLVALVIVVALVVAAFAFKLINIDEISGGSAPKVSVTGGEMPTFKVDTAKISVGTKQDEISTPTVDVGSKKTTVDVPTLSVEKADAGKTNP